MKADLLAHVTLAGVDLPVTRFSGRMGLSEPFRFEIETEAASGVPELDQLVGADVSLRIADGHGHELPLEGFASEVRRSRVLAASFGLAADAASLTFTFVPRLWKLFVGRDSRVFQDVSVADVARDVLARAGLDADCTFRLVGAHEPAPYRAQHRESDGELLLRLLGEEGIFFAFEPGDGGTKVIFTDDSTTADDLEGGATLDAVEGSGLHADREHVRDVRSTARLTSSAARIRDYDPARPKLELDARAGDGRYELYDAPGRFLDQAVGDTLVGARLEAARCGGRTIVGRTSTLRVWPGRVLEIAGHPRASLDGRYFVTQVEIDAHAGGGGAGGGILDIRFTAIPADVPYRPVAPSHRRVAGPQSGVVVGPSGVEIHPDDHARVRVQHYWDRQGAKDDTASTWMRVGQFALSGSMLTPRVGWDVLVAHFEGDIERPFVAAHLYDGALQPPYPLPANKTRTSWQTATTPGGGTSNEIRFEDAAGAEELFVNASFDMNVAVDHAKEEKVAVDFTHDIGANHVVTVGTSRNHGVVSAQSVSIGGSETITVTGNREVVISGSEDATVGGSRTVTAVGGSQLDAGGGRDLTVGGSMIGLCASAISRTTLGVASVSIAGSQIQLSGGAVDDSVGGASAENVGGAKISLAGGGYDLSCKGAMAENVGGAYIAGAGGKASETSASKLVINVGGAFLGNAPSIEIEAKTEIKIQAGGSSLTIKPGKITIKAPAIANPPTGIAKSGADVKHN